MTAGANPGSVADVCGRSCRPRPAGSSAQEEDARPGSGITNTVAGIYLHGDRSGSASCRNSAPGRAYFGDTMSGDVVVLMTALGVLFIALVAACAVAYGFWRGGL